MVVTTGLLSKAFGQNANPGEPLEGCTTNFNELVIGLAHKEKHDVYSLLFNFGHGQKEQRSQCPTASSVWLRSLVVVLLLGSSTYSIENFMRLLVETV